MWELLKNIGAGFLGKKSGQSWGQAAGSFLGGGVSDIAGGWLDKGINGIPSPKTGTAGGAQQLDYMNAAFPGTNAWERLGQSNAAAGVSAAKQQGRNQKSMQRSELSTRERIADKQMNTQKEIAGVVATTAANQLGQQKPLVEQQILRTAEEYKKTRNANIIGNLKFQASELIKEVGINHARVNTLRDKVNQMVPGLGSTLFGPAKAKNLPRVSNKGQKTSIGRGSAAPNPAHVYRFKHNPKTGKYTNAEGYNKKTGSYKK